MDNVYFHSNIVPITHLIQSINTVRDNSNTIFNVTAMQKAKLVVRNNSRTNNAKFVSKNFYDDMILKTKLLKMIEQYCFIAIA